MMKLVELHRALELALQNGPISEAADVKAGLQALAALLADYPDVSVDEFCLRARDGLQKKAKVKHAASEPAPKQINAAGADETVIVRYVSELEQTKFDSRQFEKVIDRMKKDKNVRIGEAREIAKRFTGSLRTQKTKADSLKAILQRQIEDVRTSGKLERIVDIF